MKRGRSIRLESPAKVNLFLEVTGRRRDGYHELATLFAKLDLHDDIEVSPAPRGVSLEIRNLTGTRLSAGPSNLAVRAARAFLKEFGVASGVRVRLVKRIPIGAGLGGGSSNAGTVLRAMARLFPGPGRDEKTLSRIGLSLGADVPLFCREGGLFLGKGVGERLTPIRPRKAPPPLVLVHPGVSVPTAAAYRRMRLPRRGAVLTTLSRLDKLVVGLSSGGPLRRWSGSLFNRLEEAVLPAFPRVAEAKRALLSMGAPALMTGSGSCVFAFVSGTVEGRRLVRRLAGAGWDARLVGIRL